MAPALDPPKRDPNVAAILTWFVPGAGHFYVGKPTTGFVAFLVIEGLYWFGLMLSGGRTFEFLDPELRSRFATVLSPEAGNLGMLIYHMQVHGFGLEFPEPWPPHVFWGATLSALSGVANAFVMVQAHLDARAPRPLPPPEGEGGSEGATAGPAPRPPALEVALGWLVPGLGHWLQGRRLRGVIVFVLLVGLFASGTLLAEGSNLSRLRHFYFWAGQFLLGAPAIVTEVLSGRPPVTHDIPYVDLGLTFGCVAGLLNVLALLDVYAWSEARWLGRDPLADETAGQPAEASG